MVRMILLINPHVEGCQLYVFFWGLQLSIQRSSAHVPRLSRNPKPRWQQADFQRGMKKLQSWIERCKKVVYIIHIYLFVCFCLYNSIYLSICLPACLSVYLSACLSACLSVSACLSACLSVCLPVCLPVCLSVCLSICLSACLSAYPSICLSVYLSACLHVCLAVCLSICLSAYLPICLVFNQFYNINASRTSSHTLGC